MKRYLLVFAATLTVILGLSVPSASAFSLFGDACSGANGATVCSEQNKGNQIYGPTGVLMLAANILAAVVGIAAVIIIIVSGIQYMLSQGDSGKVQSAKNTIIYAAVGLAVVILARTIIGFVVSKV